MLATLTEYGNNDHDIISQLDYYNGDSHDWYAKEECSKLGKRRGHERKLGCKLSGTSELYLCKLEMKRPESIPNFDELVPVKVGDETYYFGTLEYDKSARATNEKLQWQYRASSDEVQFFLNKDIVLTEKELALHKSYYQNTYQGRFGWYRLGDTSSFTMFVNGYEFLQKKSYVTTAAKRNTQAKKHSDALHCIWLGCTAIIRCSINPETRELCYHEQGEHVHCQMPPAKIKTVKRIDLPRKKTEFLKPSELKDSDFKRAYKKIGKQLIDIETKYTFNNNTKITCDTHWYACSSKRAFNCKARAFLRKIGDEFKFTCSTEHTHGPPKMVSNVRFF